MKKSLILTLLKTKNIGNELALKIIMSIPEENRILSVIDLYEAILLARNISKRVPIITKSRLQKTYDKACEVLDKSRENHIQVISFQDDNYPENLTHIKKKPLLIHVKGNTKILNDPDKPSIAIIGTRMPSSFGARAGERLTKYFTDAGFVIVSGLALGCDSIAHKETLKNGGKTIAVLASDLKEIYPKENQYLSEKILENNGALVSEYPIGSHLRKNFFVERNRLQSGLSQAICVIEMSKKSGTMHTVEFAEKQQRLIGALEHPENKRNAKSNGNEWLFKNHRAKPLGTKEDILSFIKVIRQASIDFSRPLDQNAQLDLF